MLNVGSFQVSAQVYFQLHPFLLFFQYSGDTNVKNGSPTYSWDFKFCFFVFSLSSYFCLDWIISVLVSSGLVFLCSVHLILLLNQCINLKKNSSFNFWNFNLVLLIFYFFAKTLLFSFVFEHFIENSLKYLYERYFAFLNDSVSLSVHWQMNKETIAYIYNLILFSFKN